MPTVLYRQPLAYSLLNARFLLQLEQVNAHCRTVFLLSDEKDVRLVGHRCPVHVLNVNFTKVSCSLSVFFIVVNIPFSDFMPVFQYSIET
jgi:hypothetical protein